MKEAELQKAVIELARRLGWRVAHFRTSQSQTGRWLTAVQGDGAGYPDLTMLRRDRIVAAELKAKGNKTSPAQDEWLQAFRDAGAIEACLR